MDSRRIEEIRVGVSAEVSKRLMEDDVRRFADAVLGSIEVTPAGDRRTVNFSEAPAACEMLCAGLISAVLSSHLPGSGARILSQSLHFRQPLFAGDTITARVTVTDKHELSNWISLSTICRNQKGDIVIDGEAVVMLSPRL